MSPDQSSMRMSCLGLYFLVFLGGCTPPYNPGANDGAAVATNGVRILLPDQTIDLENSDRIARFRRLAFLNGVAPPDITQMIVPPGQIPGIQRPVPVVRVVFDERILFGFNQDVPRPEATAVLELVADAIRRDVPDVQLTLLGHTDAVGSDQYNLDLSMRRARNVFQALVDRGCNPSELSTVAIGKNQPVAPNDTDAGRALNRRVEFLISASQAANLSIVGQRTINPAFLQMPAADGPPASPPSDKVAILKPVPDTYNGPSDFSETKPAGKIMLKQVGELPLQSEPAPAVTVAVPAGNPPALVQPAPQAPVQLRTPAPLERRTPGAPIDF